jgi:uncharacterized protein DUF1501
MIWAEPTRRDFLYGLGATLGTAALSSLVHGQDALAPKPPHRSPRAKACIYLFMEGGPSHIDTFDPKPKLASLHMKEFQRQDRFASAMASGKRYFVQSPFSFVRAGDAGIAMNSGFAQLAKVADELCIYRGLQAESIDHPTACYHMNTGNRFGGDPAIGAWVTYGLGSPNRNLPSFVVLPEVNFPQGGAANWSNGFLPAYFQGTALRAQGSPILDLRPPEGVTPEHQRKNLDLLAELNRGDARRNPHHQDPLARTASYELAFRMQMEVPAVLDLSKEDPKLLERYGIGREPTDSFGRRCLLARRLVEQGVPFVQVYAGGWDSHDYIATAHKNRIETVDRPMAALISDLKQRGLLDETLVAWGGEFGRSPDNGVRGGGEVIGRDHNAKAMTLLLAGGGVKRGAVIGATDETGAQAIEAVHPIKDFHMTLLHLLGLEDKKLTFYHEGRFKQISQTGDGNLIREVLA